MGSPWAPSSRWPRRPTGISGSARNSAYFASMAFALSPGNRLQVSISLTGLSLIVTRDGTLWIGTFAGLVSWNGAKLTRYPQLDGLFVTSLLEDRQGTVWAGTLGGSPGTPRPAVRNPKWQRTMLLGGWCFRLIRLEFG